MRDAGRRNRNLIIPSKNSARLASHPKGGETFFEGLKPPVNGRLAHVRGTVRNHGELDPGSYRFDRAGELAKRNANRRAMTFLIGLAGADSDPQAAFAELKVIEIECNEFRAKEGTRKAE